MATIATNQRPYSDLPPANVTLFEAKARKGLYSPFYGIACEFADDRGVGLSFDDIAKKVGKDEVWLAAAFYGQVSPPPMTSSTHTSGGSDSLI